MSFCLSFSMTTSTQSFVILVVTWCLHCRPSMDNGVQSDTLVLDLFHRVTHNIYRVVYLKSLFLNLQWGVHHFLSSTIYVAWVPGPATADSHFARIYGIRIMSIQNLSSFSMDIPLVSYWVAEIVGFVRMHKFPRQIKLTAEYDRIILKAA